MAPLYLSLIIDPTSSHQLTYIKVVYIKISLATLSLIAKKYHDLYYWDVTFSNNGRRHIMLCVKHFCVLFKN